MNTDLRLPSLNWFKSSYSSNGGNCLEVADVIASRGAVLVRDSKNLDAAALDVSALAFASFTAGVKDGMFAA